MLTMNGTEGTFAPGSFGATLELGGATARHVSLGVCERLAKAALKAEEALGVESVDAARELLERAGFAVWPQMAARPEGEVKGDRTWSEWRQRKEHRILAKSVAVREGRRAWTVGYGFGPEFRPLTWTLTESLARDWFRRGVVEGNEIRRMLQRIAGVEARP